MNRSSWILSPTIQMFLFFILSHLFEGFIIVFLASNTSLRFAHDLSAAVIADIQCQAISYTPE